MNLIFGHKDIPQRSHSTLDNLMRSKSFDLDKAETYKPFATLVDSEELNNEKESAQSYLDSALCSYNKKTTESFRACVHDANLAIKRRYDELLTDVLDISDRFDKGGQFEKIKRYE